MIVPCDGFIRPAIEFLLEIIRSLRDDGKTIILITHKLEEIKKIADRCAILCRGKLIDVSWLAFFRSTEGKRPRVFFIGSIPIMIFSAIV